MKNNTLKTILFLLVLLVYAAPSALAQVIIPLGTTEGPATQLVGWFGDSSFPNDDGDGEFPLETVVTVVNTSNTTVGGPLSPTAGPVHIDLQLNEGFWHSVDDVR